MYNYPRFSGLNFDIFVLETDPEADPNLLSDRDAAELEEGFGVFFFVY